LTNSAFLTGGKYFILTFIITADLTIVFANGFGQGTLERPPTAMSGFIILGIFAWTLSSAKGDLTDMCMIW